MGYAGVAGFLRAHLLVSLISSGKRHLAGSMSVPYAYPLVGSCADDEAVRMGRGRSGPGG